MSEPVATLNAAEFTRWHCKSRCTPGYNGTPGYSVLHIMKTTQDSYTITIKQIVRFQETMHFEKFQLDQVQSGRQSAIIHFHMAVIW